jgi:hypothetical protein
LVLNSIWDLYPETAPARMKSAFLGRWDFHGILKNSL